MSIRRAVLAGLALATIAGPAAAQAATPELSTSHRLQDRRYAATSERTRILGFQDGRFYANGWHIAGEMGGEGNLARLREALDTELVIRGYQPPLESSNWYASAEEFAKVYEAAGFVGIDARLIDRPTELEHGVAAWVMTFRKGWLDRAGVPQAERREIADAVAERAGSLA